MYYGTHSSNNSTLTALSKLINPLRMRSSGYGSLSVCYHPSGNSFRSFTRTTPQPVRGWDAIPGPAIAGTGARAQRQLV